MPVTSTSQIATSATTREAVHEMLASVQSFTTLWGIIADVTDRLWRISLAEAHVSHPLREDRVWRWRPQPSVDGDVFWRRRMVSWDEHLSEPGGESETKLAPGCTVHVREEGDFHDLVVPVGTEPPCGFLVFNLDPADVDDSFSRFLGVLQTDLVHALRRCSAVENEQHNLEGFRHLASASMALQSCRSIDTVVSVILETLQQDFGFDVSVLALLEGPIRLLRGYSQFPEGAVDLGSLDIPLGLSEHPLAAITNEGFMVHADAIEADDPRIIDLGIREKVYQPVWLPLIVKGEPIGLIIAFNWKNHGEIDEGLQRVLELFANHVALALETMRSTPEIHTDEAVRDSLTGLYNRRHLDRMLDQEIRRTKRYKTPLALLMIDLNDFKSYNDEHGHIAGDAILRSAAAVLQSCVRETDQVARYGGDEFVVLMPNCVEAEARAATERILAAVAKHNRDNRGRPHQQFTLTIGHHTATEDEAERILEQADRSLFDRKDDNSRRRLLDQLFASRGTPVGRHARLIFGLMKTLARKDPSHLPHARRVMAYTIQMCQRLDLPQIECEQIAMAAILHDIGKVVINPEVANRSGNLTPAEFMLVKSHPIVAADLLSELPFLERTISIIRHHHERWDGNREGPYPGYPDGLKGETVPLGARIIRIADTFDSLTTDRPYREGMGVSQACRVLEQEAGRSLDPNLVSKCIGIYRALPGPIDPDAIDPDFQA